MARARITNTTQYNARQGVSITCTIQEPSTCMYMYIFMSVCGHTCTLTYIYFSIEHFLHSLAEPTCTYDGSIYMYYTHTNFACIPCMSDEHAYSINYIVYACSCFSQGTGIPQ